VASHINLGRCLPQKPPGDVTVADEPGGVRPALERKVTQRGEIAGGTFSIFADGSLGASKGLPTKATSHPPLGS